MSTTLNIESFGEINLKERTTLTAGAAVAAQSITVPSIQGFAVGDIIYIGNLSREGCEKAVIASFTGQTTITLVAVLTLAHARFEPVTSVLGDLIHVYRAANVDGTVPADGSFTVLTTRNIDPDQLSTYYTDSSGSSSYWYKFTNYNATSLDETSLGDSVAVRGDDFGHYASLTEIRAEAGFSNNYNLKDTFVDQQRRAAEAEINTSLSNNYTTPFSPVPEIIRTLTIQLAAGLLMQAEYGSSSSKGKDKLADARTTIKNLQSQTSDITDDDGVSLAGAGLSYYPLDDSEPIAPTSTRPFVIGDKF
jgi:phage gp36-like protein